MQCYLFISWHVPETEEFSDLFGLQSDHAGLNLSLEVPLLWRIGRWTPRHHPSKGKHHVMLYSSTELLGEMKDFWNTFLHPPSSITEKLQWKNQTSLSGKLWETLCISSVKAEHVNWAIPSAMLPQWYNRRYLVFVFILQKDTTEHIDREVENGDIRKETDCCLHP